MAVRAQRIGSGKIGLWCGLARTTHTHKKKKTVGNGKTNEGSQTFCCWTQLVAEDGNCLCLLLLVGWGDDYDWGLGRESSCDCVCVPIVLEVKMRKWHATNAANADTTRRRWGLCVCGVVAKRTTIAQLWISIERYRTTLAWVTLVLLVVVPLWFAYFELAMMGYVHYVWMCIPYKMKWCWLL